MMKHSLKLQRLLLLFVSLCFISVAWAQTKTISGVVKDASGAPVIGASVVVKGTTTSTITDLGGKYKLTVPESAKTLVVSYVGMTKQELPISGSVINVTLQDNSEALDEVVVIGYGVVKKRDLTGSVSSIKSTEIMKTAGPNAMQAMQGKVSGLDIQQSSGQAGAGVKLTLRGNRSILANNSPLILVDGIEYGSTMDISPSDIESMEVLKDASSTAIYGSKGANGVIIITTKRGKSGATKVNISSYLSINTPTHVPQMMYGDKEVQRLISKANYQADKASGNWGASALTPEQVLTESLADFTELGIYKDKSYTNWLDIIMQTGHTKNIEASVSGGNDKTQFNLSLGGMFEQGLMKRDQQNRYNFKTSVDHKINNYLKTGTNMMFTYKDRDVRSSSVFSQAMKMTTITHAYTADGTLINTPNPRYAAHCNPLLDEKEGAYANNTLSSRIFGNAYLEVTPLKKLVLKTNFGIDKSNYRTGIYADYQSVGNYQSPGKSTMSQEVGSVTAYTWDNTLNYNTNFGGTQHDITVLAGTSARYSVTETSTTSGDAGAEHYYTSLFYDLSKIGTAKTITGYTQWSMLSYFGRLNYKFADKYLLTLTMRTDGASPLSASNKWGYFPSAAAAWRINEESFLKTTNWLDNLKLRGSWGLSGNSAIRPYQTMSTLSSLQSSYYFSSTTGVVSGNLPSSLGNTKLKWETTDAKEIAIDFGIFKNRISGTVNYYFTHTYDLLYARSQPASSVYPTVPSNIGESKGHGLEVTLNTVLVNTKDLQWNIDWSYSKTNDEITKLYEGVTRNIGADNTGQIMGQPLQIYQYYKSNGVWGVGEYDAYKTAWQERHPDKTIGYVSEYGVPGTIKIEDKNDDGKINDDDKYIFNQTPKHNFGMNNTITYQNVSLSVFAYARLGAYIAYDMNSQLNYETANWGDLDYWTPTNTSAKFPSPGAASTTWSYYGDALKYVKADYFKIKDITLSYKMPKKLINQIGLTNVQLYGSLKNYFTFSNIKNYDPERGGSISFPLAKQMVFGLNVEL